MFGFFLKGGAIYNALLSILTGAIVSLSIAVEGRGIYLCGILYGLCLITQFFISKGCKKYEYFRELRYKNGDKEEDAVKDTREDLGKRKILVEVCMWVFLVSIVLFCIEARRCVRTTKNKDKERTIQINDQLDTLKLNISHLNIMLEQESQATETLFISFEQMAKQQQDVAKEISQMNTQLRQLNNRLKEANE